MNLVSCLGILVLWFSSFNLVADGKSVIQIDFSRYISSKFLYSGACCKRGCSGNCEGYFLVCAKITTQTGCDVLYDTRSRKDDTKTILMPYEAEYKGRFQLFFEVRNADHHRPNALIDTYSTFVHTGATLKERWNATEILLQGRLTSLLINVRVYCAKDYYTSDCSVYCKAPNTFSEHYICDKITGQKVCLPKWGGENCDQDLDPCRRYPCMNGGQCIGVNPKTYRCVCKPGYTGRSCATALDPCLHHLNLTTPLKLRRDSKELKTAVKRVVIDKAWYRIVGTRQGQLAIACYNARSCGTEFPIHMVGSHPRFFEGIVRRSVCIAGHSDCCTMKMGIKVKACSLGRQRFFVYQLRKPLSDAMNYCLR